MFPTGSSKERYEKLTVDREPYLWRARRNALLSIPSLMPLEGDRNAHIYEPYQGMGAKGVVSMSSRILMAFYPAGRMALRLDLPPEAVLSLGADIPTEMSKGIKVSEENIQREIEQRNWRDATFQTVQQAIVAGTALEWLMPDNNIKVFRLDQFVLRRSFSGKLLEFVICEPVAADALPAAAPAGTEEAAITSHGKGAQGATPSVEMYTHVVFADGKYLFRQEIDNKTFNEGEYADNELPYFPVVWTQTPGEDYGRSKLEEVAGDLRSLESLEKAMLEGAAMASRNIIMVKPNATGGNLRRKMSKASNGDVLVGDFDMVKMVGFENFNGLQITAKQVENLRISLAQAFLINQSVQRDAERVTAYEIRKMIEEIENALGGVFSTLSSVMMGPRINRLVLQMQQQKKIPAWNPGDIVPRVITGLEALSRERDVRDSMEAAEIIGAFGDEGLMNVNLKPIIDRAIIAKGFPEAVLSPQQVQEREQQRQQQAMAMQAAAGAIPRVAQEAAKAANQ